MEFADKETQIISFWSGNFFWGQRIWAVVSSLRNSRIVYFYTVLTFSQSIRIHWRQSPQIALFTIPVSGRKTLREGYSRGEQNIIITLNFNFASPAQFRLHCQSWYRFYLKPSLDELTQLFRDRELVMPYYIWIWPNMTFHWSILVNSKSKISNNADLFLHLLE